MDGQPADQISDVQLLNEQINPLKKLRGFQKHHRIPQSVGDRDRQFLAEIALPELEEDLQLKFAALRTVFGFKRKEITVLGPHEGCGTIHTPFFHYETAFSFVENDPAKIVWRRAITNIHQPHQIFATTFVRVFGRQFTILEVSTSDDLDLDSIIDRIEDAQPDSITIDYDKDLTWCEIQIADSPATIRLETDSIRVFSRREVSPQELVESFGEFQQKFLAKLNCTGSPFLMGSV